MKKDSTKKPFLIVELNSENFGEDNTEEKSLNNNELNSDLQPNSLESTSENNKDASPQEKNVEEKKEIKIRVKHSKDLLRLEKDYFQGVYHKNNHENEREYFVERVLHKNIEKKTDKPDFKTFFEQKSSGSLLSKKLRK